MTRVSFLPSRPSVPPRSPHHWTYREPYFAVDENLERADGPIMPVGRASVEKIVLHHYVTKCASESSSPILHNTPRAC